MVTVLLKITNPKIIYNSAEIRICTLGVLQFIKYNGFAEEFVNCFGTFFVEDVMQ